MTTGSRLRTLAAAALIATPIAGAASDEDRPLHPLPAGLLTSHNGSRWLTMAEPNHLRSMVADPEGRFLLILTLAPRRLVRLSLARPEDEVVELLNERAVPELRAAASVELEEHVTEGRKVVLHIGAETADDVARVVLPDPENDGLLGAPLLFTPNEWRRTPYTSLDVWKRLYWAPCESY